MKYALALSLILLACVALPPQQTPVSTSPYPGPVVTTSSEPPAPRVRPAPLRAKLFEGVMSIESAAPYISGRLYPIDAADLPDEKYYDSIHGYVHLAIELPPHDGLVAIDYRQDNTYERTRWALPGSKVILLRVHKVCRTGDEYGTVGSVRVVQRVGNESMVGAVLFDGTPPDRLPCKGPAIPIDTQN